MQQLIEQLRTRYPEITFTEGSGFCWSPQQQMITYPQNPGDSAADQWALLHEVAHGNLGHQTYETDFELLLLEVAAWRNAKQLAAEYGLSIDEDHIQDCLDTYRDWLHRRSTCPTCGVVGLQHSASRYACHNCNTGWQVTTARFCRPYRLKSRHQTVLSPLVTKRATFI